MKTNYIKKNLCVVAMLFIVHAAYAQTKEPSKTAYNTGNVSNYDISRTEKGNRVERIETTLDDKTYKIVLVNDKITELYVDDNKVAAADWAKYGEVIAAIREQIKQNRLQAARNQVQAMKNQEQARRNQEQARLNQVQEEKNQEQAARNQQQAVRNQEQAKLNQLQEEKNQEQAARSQEQAELNQEQAQRNQAQAARNQEQARVNQLQAKKNQEQAEENQRLMKQLIGDLVSDKIIADGNSLQDLTLSDTEMTVNGTKQPEDVFKKYKEKYYRLSKGSFTFHN